MDSLKLRTKNPMTQFRNKQHENFLLMLRAVQKVGCPKCHLMKENVKLQIDVGKTVNESLRRVIDNCAEVRVVHEQVVLVGHPLDVLADKAPFGSVKELRNITNYVRRTTSQPLCSFPLVEGRRQVSLQKPNLQTLALLGRVTACLSLNESTYYITTRIVYNESLPTLSEGCLQENTIAGGGFVGYMGPTLFSDKKLPDAELVAQLLGNATEEDDED